MFTDGLVSDIRKRQREWESSLRSDIGDKEYPYHIYTPVDIEKYDFFGQLGFPGEYPFTRGVGYYPGSNRRRLSHHWDRSGHYAGYGTAEDSRDLWRREGRRGAFIAFDLPTQLGYDSDDPLARGEVGRVGVAVDSLKDFETLFEAFDGVVTLDQMSTNLIVSAPYNVILAMYIALAEKKGISPARLQGTPHNDILKEYMARATYVFPPEPSMRMIRDSITYQAKHTPKLDIMQIQGSQIRGAGATAAQMVAFTYADAIAYAHLAVEAGVDVDDFIAQVSIGNFTGSMDFFLEIARARAARRIWARIAKEKLGAKRPANWALRPGVRADTGSPGRYSLTKQRPLNNIARGVIASVAAALAGEPPSGGDPWDEALQLGHSYEARQLAVDAARIIEHEAKLCDVIDPLAGSYFLEALTDKFEAEVWEILDKIESMGGMVAAIKDGYPQREISRNAYEYQKDLDTGKRAIVGVTRFTGPREIEVLVQRTLDHPYDPQRKATAEERQVAKLKTLRQERDNGRVNSILKQIKTAAHEEEENLIPHFVDAVKSYATVGEICGVLREVFGEFRPPSMV